MAHIFEIFSKCGPENLENHLVIYNLAAGLKIIANKSVSCTHKICYDAFFASTSQKNAQANHAGIWNLTVFEIDSSL